jgi:hypothetical protein
MSKHFLWKTEITASGALLYHHNENETGQDRENRGEQFGLQLTRRLYLRGDIVHVAGIVRLGWLGLEDDLDVGVFDPRRYTTEEAGVTVGGFAVDSNARGQGEGFRRFGGLLSFSIPI